MQNKCKSITKKITSGLLALGVVATSFVGYNALSIKQRAIYDSVVYAKESNLTSNKITNGDFSSSDSATPSKVSSGWSAVTDGGSPENQILAAVFNNENYLNDSENYLDSYKLIEEIVPGSLDDGDSSDDPYTRNKSFMINAANGSGHFGYKSTSSISLDANSYYRIDVTLKTFHNVDNPNSDTNGYVDTFNSFASIYLNGITGHDADTKFEKVESTNSSVNNPKGWATYSLFIQTSEYDSLSDLSLELWLGSKAESCTGPVFFNNVQLYRYSQDLFEAEIQNTPAANKRVVRLTNQYSVPSVENAQFDSPYTNGWSDIEVCTDQNDGQVIARVDINDIDGIKHITGQINPNYALATKDIPTSTNLNSATQRNVLLINNPLDTHTALIQSSDITIKQHGYYRISVWTWRNSGSAEAQIKLIDKSNNVDTVSQSVSTTSGSDEFTGKWVEYNFYVAGNAYKDETVALQLGLDGEGYVYFDDVRIWQISYADYTSGSSKSYSQKMSFDQSATNYQVENDDFDVTENQDSLITYPLKPSSWTSTLDEDGTISGVVNTDTTQFAENLDNYSKNGMHPNNPGALPERNANNNVLMVGNILDGLDSVYTSNSITLNSNSYYHFSVYVAANSLDGTNGAYVKCYSTNETLFSISNILGGWQSKDIYIATGNSSITANIDLGFNAQGYAFFDKIHMETSSEDAFNEAKELGTYTLIDLSNESFENYIDDSTTWKYQTSTYTGTNVQESGVANLNKGQFDGIVASAQNGNNVLYITSDEDSYYYFKSNSSYSFEAGSDKFYKLSIYVQTHLNEQDPDAATEDSIYGASITLNYANTSKTLYGINTNVNGVNTWREYAFYLSFAEATTGTLQLALGSDKGTASGLVMFDNITLNTIDEDEYDAALNNDYSAVIKTTASSSDDESSSNSSFDGTFSWYLIPSLITALAIFVAIIGTMIRKINWKSSPKVKTSYDRASTLNKDLSSREQIAEREALVAELQSTLSQNEKEMEGLKNKFKEEETNLKTSLDEKNKELIDNLKSIDNERKKLDSERNTALAKDKASYTEAQEKQYRDTLKSIEKAQKKYSAKLDAAQKELTTMQEKHKQQLNDLNTKNNQLKNEIKSINKQIQSIKRKELKRVGIDDKDIEISVPDEK